MSYSEGSIGQQLSDLLHRIRHANLDDAALRERFFAELTSDAVERACSQSTALRVWQQEGLAWIGRETTQPILVPGNNTPFWHDEIGYGHGFRSRQALPDACDILIVGAGLTGASAAFTLSKAASGQKIVLVDAEFPCAQSSGRNGGNFQILSEEHFGCYDGILGERLEYERMASPSATEEQHLDRAERVAKALLAFTVANAQAFLRNVSDQAINCDLSKSGWLRIASSAHEEAALADDRKRFSTDPVRMDLLQASDIRQSYGVQTKFSGLLMNMSGNYHPVKYAIALINEAIKRGVDVYTESKVASIVRAEGGGVNVRVRDCLRLTDHCIKCKRVIVATNAFTGSLFPVLKPDIACIPSQIVDFERVPNTLRGATVTDQEGEIYFNIPKETWNARDQTGMLHYGTDWDRAIEPSFEIAVDQPLFEQMLKTCTAHFPQLRGRVPSRAWAGPMAITPDRIPLIGFTNCDSNTTSRDRLARGSTDIVLAVAFQGFGGSFCTLAGEVAAHMALTQTEHPLAPASIFGPDRFTSLSESEHARLLQAVAQVGTSCSSSAQ